VLLRPVPAEPDSRVEAAITAGPKDVRAGRVTPGFQSMEEFEAYRRSPRYKKLIRDDA
jgi:hypothetical protein